MNLRHGATSANRLISALSREDIDHILPELQPVSWSIKKVVYEVGDPIDDVYFIEQGIASVLTVMADRTASEVGMIGLDGMVGASALLGAARAAQQVIVQIPGTALRMNAARCKVAFDERIGVRAVVLRFVNGFTNLSAQTAGCNLRHSARERCARWLLMARDRAQSDEMPMTQEFLAWMLGVRRTGVTAIAGDLQRSGLIQYHHGRIRIIDRVGLEATACECYGKDRDWLGLAF